MLVCFYVLITQWLYNSLFYEIKNFRRNIIRLSNDLHYSWYRENHYGCVPGYFGLLAHSLSFRGILFLILTFFHVTPTLQSLSWAFWNDSCSQQIQIVISSLIMHPGLASPSVVLLMTHITETQVWGRGLYGPNLPFSLANELIMLVSGSYSISPKRSS